MLTPENFLQVKANAVLRSELTILDAPAPARLAPYALSYLGEIEQDHAFADSRIVLMSNPAGDPSWNATTRIVLFVKSEVEDELAEEPLILEIGWQWLTETLEKFDAHPLDLSGTVTRTSSKGYGSIDEHSPSSIEIRASWSAVDELKLANHLTAWSEVVCLTAGLSGLEPGVTQLRSKSK